MTTITLTSTEVQKFNAFLEKHNSKTFFLAKDQGAYVGASGGKREDDTFENILFHFAGCNPKTDNDSHETADDLFGYDDFGEHLDVDIIHTMAKMDRGLKIKVTPKEIKFIPGLRE